MQSMKIFFFLTTHFENLSTRPFFFFSFFSSIVLNRKMKKIFYSLNLGVVFNIQQNKILSSVIIIIKMFLTIYFIDDILKIKSFKRKCIT